VASTPRHGRVTHIAIALALVPAAAIGAGLTRLGEPPVTETVTALAGSGGSPAAHLPARAPYPDAASSAPGRLTGATSPSPSRRLSTTKPTPASTRTTTRRPAVGLIAPAQQLTDLHYVTGSASPAQTLDLYLPERTGRPVPLVIDIHGGAFMAGAKSEDAGRIDALVAQGYAVASLNYRLTDEAPFPAGVKDVKAAVRWLRASSARYGIDPGAFAAWGDSAGGYFATMLGTTSRQGTSFDDPTLGNATVSSAVQAVVAFYAPGEFRHHGRAGDRSGRVHSGSAGAQRGGLPGVALAGQAPAVGGDHGEGGQPAHLPAFHADTTPVLRRARKAGLQRAARAVAGTGQSAEGQAGAPVAHPAGRRRARWGGVRPVAGTCDRLPRPERRPRLTGAT